MNKPPERTAASYMPGRALWTGIFLILISIWAVMAEGVTLTALGPGAVGLLIAVLGIVAERAAGVRVRAINAALGLALLALLGSLPGIPGFITLLRGGTVPDPIAALTQFATIFICLAFLVRGYVAWTQGRRKQG